MEKEEDFPKIHTQMLEMVERMQCDGLFLIEIFYP